MKAFVKVYSLSGHQEANKVGKVSAGPRLEGKTWLLPPCPCQNILVHHITNSIYTSKTQNM